MVIGLPRFAIFAVTLCAIACVQHSHAAFVNISIENENAFFANHPNQSVRNGWNALGGTLDVYRVYANFRSATPLDHVFRAFGTPEMPSFLTSTDGLFYNYTEPNGKGGTVHFDSPVWPGFFTQNPQFAWDTFATVGFGPFNYQGGFFSDPGGAALNHLETNWVNHSVEWLHGPSFPQEGDAVAGGPSGYRVGLFQATVAAGVDITGQFAIDTGYGIFWGDNTYFTTIPAPATAIALLALPFLTSRRRK